MADPFLSEIRIFSFTYAPKGWALCNGQLLPINQNQALFSLLGTTYGGNGQTNFALPNLQGRTPIHVGNNHTLGERAGEQAHSLTTQEMPTHSHVVNATNDKSNNTINPGSTVIPANSAPSELYTTSAANTDTMLPEAISNVGSGQPHANMQPYLVLNFGIALQGIFPSRN